MSKLTAIAALCVGLTAGAVLPAQAQPAKPIPIVAAENFYGDIAKQIGGVNVAVTSILTNPDQDPHLFEASASVARNLSAARLVIYNGIDYDPWVAKLLGAAKAADRKAIVVADLIGKKTGDNPHIWYDPATMRALAKTLAESLAATDPAHAADYNRNLAKFERSVQPIQARITALHARLAGTPATATEPVFGYMFDALGMTVRNASFQLSVMNNTEPSASDVAAFENDLKAHQVKLLVYNSQASDPVAARMEKLAKAAHVPVVGATETEPPGKTYQAWMLSELDAVDHAPAEMSFLAFEDARLSLGQRVVLGKVNLRFVPGEFVGVLGPNAAGKTTLMRAVLGLVRPAAGQVTVLGRKAARGNPSVGYMPQSRGMAGVAGLSGWEFVAGVVQGHRLGLPLLGRAGRAELDRVLDLVDARDLARRPLAELSGGERQRLLFAQALVGRPKLLLLDEPLISLDPHHQMAMVALAKRLQIELGLTVLFSAHELNPLLGAMDRVLYLGGGQAALGTVDAVITGPVLSRLYGSDIDVVRVGGRIFVMAGQAEAESGPHGAHLEHA